MLKDELRRARTDAGMTQEDLSFAAEVDRTYISELENGHKSPTVDLLFRICGALKIRASEMLARVEDAELKSKKRGGPPHG
jgi:transcriptional regulator with XRE-family HTH domain